MESNYWCIVYMWCLCIPLAGYYSKKKVAPMKFICCIIFYRYVAPKEPFWRRVLKLRRSNLYIEKKGMVSGYIVAS